MASYILVLFINLLLSVSSIIVLPFNTINIHINESLLNNDHLSKIFTNEIYTNLSIGTQKEEIKAILKMNQVGFFIYDSSYKFQSSSSFNSSTKLKTFMKRNYEEGFIANDTFWFKSYPTFREYQKQSKNAKNKIEPYLMKFCFLKSEQKKFPNNPYKNYGIIGMGQGESQDVYSLSIFIKALKENEIIKSYSFSFSYKENANNFNYEGFLIFDEELSDSDFYSSKQIRSFSKSGQLFWNLNFAKIIVETPKDNSTIYAKRELQTKDVELISTLPYIIGTAEYKNFVNYHFFQKLRGNDTCRFQNVTYDEDYGTYVCNSKSELFIDYYKNHFPQLTFHHYTFNTTFYLNESDLFAYNSENKSDSLVYFLVLFSNKKEVYHHPEHPYANEIPRWKLGIPFLKKYKFYFNYDSGVITYVPKKVEESNKGEEKDKSIDANIKVDKKVIEENKIKKIIYILILIIVVFFLGMLFHRKLVKLPRKRQANELEDEFEYKPHQKYLSKIAKTFLSDKNYINDSEKNHINMQIELKFELRKKEIN